MCFRLLSTESASIRIYFIANNKRYNSIGGPSELIVVNIVDLFYIIAFRLVYKEIVRSNTPTPTPALFIWYKVRMRG